MDGQIDSKCMYIFMDEMDSLKTGAHIITNLNNSRLGVVAHAYNPSTLEG